MAARTMRDTTPGPSQASPTDCELIGYKELCRLLDIGKTTLFRQMNLGTIPLGVRVGTCRRWVLAEIREWIAAGCPKVAEWAARRK